MTRSTPIRARSITLEEIREARTRIAHVVTRTPMFRLELGADHPDIRLKLENLQPTNSYKLRGAVNAVTVLPDSARERGVWTISAGNAGQGVAYAARRAGVPCTVVAIETAPASKIEVITETRESRFVLEVRDSGSGLTAEQIANVGVFQQSDRSTRERQGTGLGLATARLLAELNGGGLALESEPGRGTAVSVSLPLAS